MSNNIDGSHDNSYPKNITELLSYSLAMEEEAAERYSELADLMSVHNNDEIAGLFRKMASIEELHIQHIRGLLNEYNVKETSPKRVRWLLPDGPETMDPGDLHYLMTPRQALILALHNEQRARDHYYDLIAYASGDDMRELAGKLAEEEQEHVNLIKDWLDGYPENDDDWDHDDDPPGFQD